VILDTNALATPAVTVPPRTDPPPRAKPPTREQIRAADMRSTMSYLKNFVTDKFVDAEYAIAQMPKTMEADRKFRELRDKWVAEHPDLVKANPKLGNNAGDTVWWMYETKNETLDKIRAGGLKMPVVIIWGWNDSFAPHPLGVDVMNTISKVVPRSELHFINRSGHFVASEHPLETARLITGFVFA
jgi:pimeloyl-ACP methyl ester carboxylesterase